MSIRADRDVGAIASEVCKLNSGYGGVAHHLERNIIPHQHLYGSLGGMLLILYGGGGGGHLAWLLCW